MRGFFRRSVIACAAVACCAGMVFSQEIALTLDDSGQGKYRLEGSFLVQATRDTAWQVLTDYNGISRYVSSLKLSRVLGRRDGKVLLEQEAIGGVFVFSRNIRVLLEVSEEPPHIISFEDISQQDFKTYAGSWRIEPEMGGVKVTYLLDAQRNFLAPGFVAKRVFQKNVEKLLAEVRAEILRRSSAIPKKTEAAAVDAHYTAQAGEAAE